MAIAIAMGLILSASFACAEELAVRGPVTTPIKHQSMWQTERQLFGYKPEFSPGEVSFDQAGKPYIVRSNVVQTLDESGHWIDLEFTPAIKAKYPNWNGLFQQGDFADEQIVFDADDHAYMLVQAFRSNIALTFLLYSKDHCRTWQPYELSKGFARIERRDGHNDLSQPPAILLWPNAGSKLNIVTPRKTVTGHLEIPEPVLISDSSLMTANHSGGGNNAVSSGDDVFIVWPDKTLPSDVSTTGTPCYVAVFNRDTQQLTKSIHVGTAGSVLDNHNQPAIAIDGKGVLHVILGAHHEPFRYTHALSARSTTGGWTEPVDIGRPRPWGAGSYTYAGFICDQQDNLHVIARWAGDGYWFRLVHMIKPADQPWQDHATLIEPFRGNYGVWYHKFNIDRNGSLWLSYNYCGGFLLPEETAAFAKRFPSLNISRGYLKGDPGMIVSRDMGKTWTLATTSEFNSNSNTSPPVPETSSTETLLPTVAPKKVLQLGGELRSIDVNDQIAVAAVGDRLVILDARDPSNLTEIAQLPGLQPNRSKVKLYDSVALVANGNAELLSVDLTKPDKPRVTARLRIPDVRQISIHSRTALAVGVGGVTILDLQDPLSPVTTANVSFQIAHDAVWIDDRTAFIALGKDGCALLDISQQAAPRVIKSFDKDSVTGDAFALCLMDNLLLISPGPNTETLRIVDISSPTAPAAVSTLSRPNWGWGLRTQSASELALLPCTNGINVVDLSSPESPQPIMEWAAEFRCWELAIRGNLAFAACGSRGLHVIDFSNPRRFKYPGSYAYPQTPWTLTANSKHLYVGDWPSKLRVFDIAEDGSLTDSTTFDFDSHILDIDCNESLIAVAVGGSSVKVVRTAEAKNKNAMPITTITTSARDVAVNTNQLFVANSENRIDVFDIAKPDTPIRQSSTRFENSVFAIDAAYGKLWVTTEKEGSSKLLLFDVSPSGELIQAAPAIALPAEPWNLQAGDGHALLACGSAGVFRVNFRENNTASPTLAYRYEVSTDAWDVAGPPGLMFIAGGSSGLAGYQTSNKE